MSEFFSASPVLAWSLVSIMLALAITALLWTKVVWWWHNTWYSFPLIGKISSLKNDTNRDITDPTWFKAEKTLCRDYKKFIRIQDEYDFNEKISYITKAGDNGRREIPILIWVLTIALVVVEAMGFSYVLAGFTLPGASENLQQLGAYGIGFILSILLVGFTHFAGHELCKSGKIKQARQKWIESRRVGKPTSGDVALAKQQSIDDDQPDYVQLMNRVGDIPTYKVSILTAVLVIIVAIGATYVRGQVLEKQLQQQVTGQSGDEIVLSVKASDDGLDMSVKSAGQGILLPADDAAANRRADEKAVLDGVNIDRHGGWGTFIVLAFIFIFLQILGVLFGFRWGFIGRDSSAAFRSIGSGRYTTYSDVRQHYKDIADTAQSKLEHLQQKMMFSNGQNGTEGIHTSNTFYDFMDDERVRETEDRAKEISNEEKRRAMESTSTAARPIKAQATETLDSAMQKIEAMGSDKEAKRTYIQNLPQTLKEQVKQALKAQKEAAVRDPELDDLL